MKFSKTLYISFLLTAALSIPTTGYSQCKNFAKKKCMPDLAPFIHNGQLNSTVLLEGESAELLMTFYSGQQYRIIVCGQDNLGKINFKMMDTDRNVIFDSSEQNSVSFWDFNVNSTQQFLILVSTQKPKSNSKADLPGTLIQSGCVALLVGFKD